MSETLLSCPFCNSADIHIDAPYRHLVICYGCGACGPIKMDGKDTPETAIAGWNRRAVLAPVEMGGWKPIDTAPKDGDLIYLYPNCMVGVWDHGAENWMVMNIPLDKRLRVSAEYAPGNPYYEVMANSFGMPEPTHWMPLPDAPK